MLYAELPSEWRNMKCAVLLSTFCLLTGNLWAACTEFQANGQHKLSCTVSSGLKTGGSGSDYGKWLEISSTPERPATESYKLESVTFRLEGPHPCSGEIANIDEAAKKKSKAEEWADLMGNSLTGPQFKILPTNYVDPTIGTGSWAQCEQKEQTDKVVTWRFRFQGWTAEDRSIGTVKNSTTDPSCKQPDLTQEKKDYCNQESIAVGWKKRNEAIKEGAKLLTIWVKQ